MLHQNHSWVFIWRKQKVIRKDKWTLMFIVALFTMAKIQKQCKCSSTDDKEHVIYMESGNTGQGDTCKSRRHKRHKFNPWVRKIPWRRTWTHTQLFLLEESMDRKAWWATVHRFTGPKSRTWLKQLSMHAHSLNFSSIQSLSCVQLFEIPWTAACQSSLSITNSQGWLKLMSI